MVKTIVVALDGSDFALRALPIGAELALHVDADLVLVTTTMARHPGTGMSPVWLDAASASVTGVTVRTEVLDEHPAAAAIATVMGSVPDPVLCMATHGWGAIRTSVLGSVAEDVVRTLGAPFLLVGPHAAADRGRTSEFTGPVVIGHDGSPAADAVLPAALEWARALETGILVVNAFHPLDVESACTPTAAVEPAVDRLRAGGVNTGVRVVRSSFPAGEILEAAARGVGFDHRHEHARAHRTRTARARQHDGGGSPVEPLSGAGHPSAQVALSLATDSWGFGLAPLPPPTGRVRHRRIVRRAAVNAPTGCVKIAAARTVRNRRDRRPDRPAGRLGGRDGRAGRRDGRVVDLGRGGWTAVDRQRGPEEEALARRRAVDGQGDGPAPRDPRGAADGAGFRRLVDVDPRPRRRRVRRRRGQGLATPGGA